MALSIGEYNQRLINQIQGSKELYMSMAKGTPIEHKLSGLYTNLTIAYRNYALSISSGYLKTQSKPTTNIYMQNGKVVGVDHRDYEKEYWDQKRIQHEAQKPYVESELLRALREIDEALNSVPKIKEHKERGLEQKEREEKLKKEILAKQAEKESKDKTVGIFLAIICLIITMIPLWSFEIEGFFAGVLGLIIWVSLFFVCYSIYLHFRK